MPEERLIVGGTFDPSGIVTGVKGGTAALEEFERRIQQIAASLPGINVEEFLAGARKAAQEEIADLQRLQTEANRTSAALNDAGVSTRRMAGGFMEAAVAATHARQGMEAWAQGLANLRTQITTTADVTAHMLAAFNVAGEAGRRASEGTAAWSTGLANLRVQVTSTVDATTRMRDAFNVAGEAGRRGSEGTAAWQQGLANLQAQLIQVNQRQREAEDAATRTARAFGVEAAAVRRASESSTVWARGLANLQAQLQQVQALQAAAGTGAQRMAAGFAAAGAQAQAGRAGSDAWAAGLANLQVQSTAAVNGTAGMTKGANMARTALVSLAAQSIGTSSAIGSLAQSALFFAGGSAVIAGVAAAILVAAKAVEVFTAKEREAKRVHEDLLASLKQRVEAADNTPASQRGAQRAEIQRLQIEAQQIQAILNETTADAVRALTLRFELQKNINAQEKLSADLIRDEAAAAREYAAARFGPGQDLIADLGRELAVLQTSADAVARLAIVGANLTEGQRAAALAIHDQTVALRAQQEAAEKAAEGLEKVLKAQHDLRVEQAGGGNLTPGAGGTDTGLPIGGGGLMFGATGEQIGASHAAAIARATEAMEKFRQATQAAIDASDFSQMVEQLRNANKVADEFAKALAKAARSEGDKLADSLLDIASVAFSLADVGTSLGFIGEQAARSLVDVANLGVALAAVAKDASTGNILGAIVSGASFIGGLFGGGPTEGDRLQAETNQRLLDLKLSLDKSILGAGALEVAARDVAILRDAPRVAGPLGMAGLIDEDVLRAQLAAAGQTIEEWAARIKAVTGIDVITDSGVVIQRAAEDAAKALGLMREQVTQFGDSVGEQARKVSNRDRILGTGTDLTRNREVLLGGLNLDKLIEDRIAGLDLDTEGGRTAYRQFLIFLQEASEAGGILAEQLGTFADVGELSDKAAEGADALAAAAQDAASRIADAAAEEVRARQAATEALQGFINDAVTRSQFQGGDSARQFADLAGFLKGSGFDQSPALRAVLEQANTASAEGREALKQALFDLLVKAQFETLTPDQLGALSPDALEELIRQLGGLIDGISNDANRAADERRRAAEDAERSAEQVRRDQEAAARAARQAFEEARRQAVDARREQERLGELRERLAGSDQSAAAKFARDVARLQDAMPQVGDILEGLDLDDPKSREVLRKRLAALFDQFTGGDFEKLNFTRDEFLAFLEKGADFLDEFGNSVNDATKQMLNFPTGINLAALEFQAQAAGAKDVARILPVALPSRRGTDGAALPQIIDDRLERAVVAMAERTGGDTITYNVTVHLPRGSTAEQARAFVEALKRQSVVRTGSPDKWSQG